MGFFSKKSVRWTRQPGDIAIRIEAADIRKDGLNRPFIVEDGTVALFFRQGVLEGRLVSGKHDIDGRLRSWLVGDDPTTLILTDDGDITLDVEVAGLSSRENVSLGMSLRLTLSLSSPEDFYRNVMKGQKRYLDQDLRDHLRPELQDGLQAFTGTHPIDDLYQNPDLRRLAAEQINQRVGESLGRLGFSLVALNVARVTSEQFDPHLAKRGDLHIEGLGVDLEAERFAVLQKARENLAAEGKHKAVTEADLRHAINQAMHELKIKERLQADELAKLNAQLELDAAEYEQQRTQVMEKGQLEHELDQKSLEIDAFLEQKIKEASAKSEVGDIERETDKKDWEFAKEIRDDALEARAKKKAQDIEFEAQRIETVSKADTATKIALELGDKDALLELERIEMQKDLTPDQMLVMAAEKSDELAAALAEKFKADGRLNDEVIDQLRRQIEQTQSTDREHAAQLERVMKQALESMGKVATAKAESQGPGDQTIVTGGAGQPTIINPKQPSGEED